MTTDFDAPTRGASRAPSHAASINLVATGWSERSAAYHDALTVLIHAVPGAATFKNVPVKPEYHPEIARDALRELNDDEMAALVLGDGEATARARFAVSRALDTLAATMVGYLVLHLRGIDQPSHAALAAVIQAWLPANGNGGSVYVWPDLLDAALKYNCPVAAHE